MSGCFLTVNLVKISTLVMHLPFISYHVCVNCDCDLLLTDDEKNAGQAGRHRE